MTNEEITLLVNKTFQEEFEIDEKRLVPQANIMEDLGLDSLDIVDLILVLEQAFQFKIPDRSAFVNIKTLGDLYTFIAGLRDAHLMEK